jgi:hypothetical protein
MLILLWPLPARSGAAITLQVGPAPSYEYPFEPSGERAVSSDHREIAGSFQLTVPLTPRWGVLAGAKYWTDEGPVVLPRIPENPGQDVEAWILPAYAGVRFRANPSEQPLALYIELAAGLTVLRSTVRTQASWFNDDASEASAADVAPSALGAVSLHIPTWRFMSLAFTASYLHSADFPNDEKLIINRDFDGIHRLVVMGGIDLRIPF